MNQTSKLLFALQQTENIIKLMEGNEYERFFSSHLSPIIYELNRQLTNQTESVKINNDA